MTGPLRSALQHLPNSLHNPLPNHVTPCIPMCKRSVVNTCETDWVY